MVERVRQYTFSPGEEYTVNKQSSVRLSIIIPVYNVESYIDQTLASVFKTTAKIDDFEVIVVNDGTKDRSMDIVRQFSYFSNLIIVEQENQGLSAARMKGSSAATGDYLWFIDSDDWLAEDGVGKVLELLDNQPGVDALMFPTKWVYKDRNESHLDYEIKNDFVLSGKLLIRDMDLPLWSSPRFVFKRSLLENEFLFFPNGLIHEDEYFGRVLMYYSKEIVVLKDPVYMYRIRPGSITTSKTIRSSYDLVSLHKLLKRFMDKSMEKQDEEWFERSCYKLLISAYKESLHFSNWERSRFAASNGFYVWRQWLKVFPEKSIKNKLGRLFYFILPCVHDLMIGNTDV